MKKEKKKRLQRLARRRRERVEQRKAKVSYGEGILSMSKQGYGFVNIPIPATEAPDKMQEIFIPPRAVADAMNGDTVKVEFSVPENDSNPEHGPVGKVVEVLNRVRTTVVGEVIKGRKVRPINRKIPADIQLSGSLKGAKLGDWVEVKLLPQSEKSDSQYLAGVVDNFGEAGVISADLDAICCEYQLQPPYSEEQNQRAAMLEPQAMPRRDLRAMPVITIDPVDAKDFDDAIGIAPSAEAENEVILAVHIADVAAYIAPESDFDHLAAKRGFTAYLPGRTLPMLAKTLTAKISLQENAESLAHTVLFYVNTDTGEVRKTERCHSVIKVDKRLNYKEVQTAFDSGNPPCNWNETVRNTVFTAFKIARLWRKKRWKTEQFLELDMPEIRVICDETTNRILGIASKVQRESEQLIEEFMLAANVAVAQELQQTDLPGLFRVHPAPEPEKLEEFLVLAADTFHLHPGDLTNRKNINKFLESLPDNELKPLISGAFLRALPRAYYQALPALHFGLGKTLYSHFTSPIRRYTDLLVHQQLWSKDENAAWKNRQTMVGWGERLSSMEENNDAAYFAANDRLKLRYLAEQLADHKQLNYTGIVRKNTAAGLLVDVAQLGVYGFVPRSKLLNSWQHRRENRGLSAYSGKEFEVGDLILLSLEDIDFEHTSAIFSQAVHL